MIDGEHVRPETSGNMDRCHAHLTFFYFYHWSLSSRITIISIPLSHAARSTGCLCARKCKKTGSLPCSPNIFLLELQAELGLLDYCYMDRRTRNLDFTNLGNHAASSPTEARALGRRQTLSQAGSRAPVLLLSRIESDHASSRLIGTRAIKKWG